MTRGFWKDVARDQGFQGQYDTKRLSDHISVAIFNVSEEAKET